MIVFFSVGVTNISRLYYDIGMSSSVSRHKMFLWNNFYSSITIDDLVWFGLWCLMPLSTIFQLYRGDNPFLVLQLK